MTFSYYSTTNSYSSYNEINRSTCNQSDRNNKISLIPFFDGGLKRDLFSFDQRSGGRKNRRSSAIRQSERFSSSSIAKR
jgi:hypothetical protein